ncbi:MAG TPA: hypothetical protein VGW40_12895 [Allosphingosinicella sp.]|nr:hypothetical protein [Allosphingosinicella sp.]
MPGVRPFTRRQAAENAAFLDQLRRTGNSRLAARAVGAHRAKFTKRRAKHAAFAAQWEMALAAAHAAMTLGGGPRPPEACPERSRRGKSDALRTEGGEPTIVRLKSGRLQLRLAPPGRMTKAAEQAFFRALAASANIRLSAAAAGFSCGSFYYRKYTRPAFAREMRLALKIGCERLECVLHATSLPESWEDDSWRNREQAPIPPMTADQALHLLHLHYKSVDLSWDRPHRRKRRGEPWEAYTERMRAMWVSEKRREAEDAALRRAAQYETTGDWRYEEEQPPPPLPPLELVTGWSKADPNKKPHHPGVPLFGGWRLADWEKRKRKAGKG